MAAYGTPILYTLFVWWFSTVAILYLDGRDRRTFGLTMAASTALLVLSIWGIFESFENTTSTGVLEAFVCGLCVWGWQLVSFYLGYVTGPRKTACEPGLGGWPRFLEATKTSWYHELTVCASAALLAYVSWDEPNKLALWTFLTLWWMHQSAKLNVFFGVPNLGEHFLPEHLRYLSSFMTRKSMNFLFPVSVTISTMVTVLFVLRAVDAPSASFESQQFVVLATLMVLAVVEHWLLVTPFDIDPIWRWGVKPMPLSGATGSMDAAAVRFDGRDGASTTARQSSPPLRTGDVESTVNHLTLEIVTDTV